MRRCHGGEALNADTCQAEAVRHSPRDQDHSVRPDIVQSVRRSLRPDDMLETFSELAVKEPDLMRLTLQASVAALVNVLSVEAVDAELKVRAVAGN
jgi:hypothetical protein